MLARLLLTCFGAVILLARAPNGLPPKKVDPALANPPSTLSLEAQAEKGDAEAAHELGDRYAEGRMGLPKDQRTAATWYQKSAALGNAGASSDLGWYFLNGLGGLPVDAPKAFACFLAAAQQNHVYATHMVAWMYEYGRGVNQDDVQAAIWHERAARLGDIDSLAELGWLTEQGRGVPKNEEAAAQLYAMAVGNGNAQAMNALGWFYIAGKGGLAKDYETARRLFESASVLGWARADGNLGYLYENGLGVTKNLSTAMTRFRMSADEGDLLSQAHLGYLYESGQLVEKDPEKAFHYYRLAADQGDLPSIDGLIRVLATAPNIPQEDAVAAFGTLTRLCEKQVGRARIALALALLRGTGASPDRVRAHDLLLDEVGVSTSSEWLIRIARILESGRGLPEDRPFAKQLLEAVAARGSAPARVQLAKDLILGPAQARRQGVAMLEAMGKAHDPLALFELGLLFQNGQGVPSSPLKAIDCFRASAGLGYAPAMFQLALVYHLGLGVKKSFTLAREWYLKADAAHYPPARGRVRPDGSLVPPLEAAVPESAPSSSK